jgi:hypothetical protein
VNRFLPSLTAVATLFAAALSSVQAQSQFPTDNPNVNVTGILNMCLGPDNKARACNDLTSPGVRVLNLVVPPYPIGPRGGNGPVVGALPITGNASGTTGAVVGTLAAAPGRITYLCNVDVSVIGGTAAVGPIVIAGLTGGSFTYQASSTAAGGLALSRTFTPCIPASGIATAITITTTADGTATAVNVNASGYQL